MTIERYDTYREYLEMLEFRASQNPDLMVQGTGDPVRATEVIEILRKIVVLKEKQVKEKNDDHDNPGRPSV